MPAKLMIADKNDVQDMAEKVKLLFENLDNRFSTYKFDSEISKFNRGEIDTTNYPELKFILSECERTRIETNGYFDSHYGLSEDPSGLVKGYAINQAAKLLQENGYANFLVEIAGDVATSGSNGENLTWTIGIENPFNRKEVVKVVKLSGQAIATSGIAVHSDHIVNPITHKVANEIASLSVITDNVYDADRMATAAYAMGERGIEFLNQLPNYSGYMITNDKRGIMTEGFKQYVK